MQQLDMPLTESQRDVAILAFSKSVSEFAPGLVVHRPSPLAQPTDCIANVLDTVAVHGGRIRYGWYFQHRYSPDHGDYLIAVHHAVWHDPSDESLVDVTPFHSDELHRPLLKHGSVMFLFDPHAYPIKKDNKVIPLPLRYFPIGSDPDLVAYVESLQQQENHQYNAEHGTDFPCRPNTA